MEPDRFAALTKSLSSRRTTLGRLLAGGALATLGLATSMSDVDAAPCPKGKKKCKGRCIPKRGCCTTAQCRPKGSGKICKRGRCVCGAGTKSCQGRCLPRAAACPPQPAASCRPGGGLVSGYAWYLRNAQTFTEPNGGRLTAAALWIRKYSAATIGTYELRLNTVAPGTGVPQEATLAVAQRASADISDTSLDWVSFAFPVPPRLEPGQQYALVLSMIGGTGFEGWVTELRSPDPCPGGAFFQANNPGPFNPLPNTDTPYQTFVTA